MHLCDIIMHFWIEDILSTNECFTASTEQFFDLVVIKHELIQISLLNFIKSTCICYGICWWANLDPSCLQITISLMIQNTLCTCDGYMCFSEHYMLLLTVFLIVQEVANLKGSIWKNVVIATWQWLKYRPTETQATCR